MRLAVISDLHLAPGSANRCTASPAQLVELCDVIEDVADRALVAGDLFDLDRPRIPGDWRAHLEQVRADFPDVLARLQDYEWIFGNHDGVLCRTGVPEERAWVADGLRVLACHGHQWDMPLKKLPALAPTANFVAGWLHRGGLEGASAMMGGVPLVLDRLWYTRTPTAPGPDRSLRGATELLAREGWDMVICGHSHRLRLIATDHGLFVNTGSICTGHVDWILVDTEQAHVQAFRDGDAVQQARLRGDRWIVEGEVISTR